MPQRHEQEMQNPDLTTIKTSYVNVERGACGICSSNLIHSVVLYQVTHTNKASKTSRRTLTMASNCLRLTTTFYILYVVEYDNRSGSIVCRCDSQPHRPTISIHVLPQMHPESRVVVWPHSPCNQVAKQVEKELLQLCT